MKSLEECKMILYSSISAEYQAIVRDKEIAVDKQIQDILHKLQSAGHQDVREDAARDAIMESLDMLYKERTKLAQQRANFENIQNADLYQILFPNSPVVQGFKYKSVGKVVPYAAVRLEIVRESGTVSERVILVLPEGLDVDVSKREACAGMCCCCANNNAIKRMLGAEAGTRIEYTCSTGETVMYVIKEIL